MEFCRLAIKRLFVRLFLNVWLFLERRGITFICIRSIKPDGKTKLVFNLLKVIYGKAEEKGIKVWVTGSWAITGRYGNYIKNIRDIDLVTRTRDDEEKLSELLASLGFLKRNNSPMGANRFFDPRTKIEIDFGSVVYPETTYYDIPLDEKETIAFQGFTYRVLPIKSHLKVYYDVLLTKGRSFKNDLMKIKILSRVI